MSLISIISFSFCLIILISSVRKGSDLFSPAKVFAIIWTMAIGLADLKLSRLQHEWTNYGWLVLLLGILSFFVGTFVVYVINFEKRSLPLEKVRSFFSPESVDEKKFLKVIIAVSALYFLSYLGNYLFEGTVPLFHKDAARSRMTWGVFGIGLTIHAATTLVIIVVAYIKITKPGAGLKWMLISLIIFTFLSYLLLLQRFNLMFAIIGSLVFLYYSSNFLRPRNAFIAILVIVGLIYSVQFLRMSTIALNYLFVMAKMKFHFKYAIFTEPYMYVVMNLENFTRAVDRLDTHTYGYYSFNFLTSLSGTRKLLSDYLFLNQYPYLNSSYNTYSMFWDYYRDFGIVGVTSIPFILGFLISTVYYRMKAKPSLTLLFIYSVCIFIIFMSFFVSIIGLLHFVFNFLLIILISLIVANSKHTKDFSCNQN
jgi:oligosaccharide repeat unit polymerase